MADMIQQFKNRNFYFVLVADLLMFAASLFLAYVMRFGVVIPPLYFQEMVSILPWVLLLKAVVFFALGAYRGMWRYTSIRDAYQLVKASLLASMAIIVGLTYINRFGHYPRSVFIADFVATCFLLGGLRAGIRMAYQKGWTWLSVAGTPSDMRDVPARMVRLLIVGAGDAADKIIREIQDNRTLPYKVVCCLDDSPSKQGRSLQRIPVRGPVDHLAGFAHEFAADEVLIAIPSASGDQMRHVVQVCEKAGIRYRTLPPISGLVDGRVSINDLRDVDFEDLLGRPPVQLDMREIGGYLAGKTVMVTGAGGYIGAELGRQIMRFNPAGLVMIDSSEYNLYRIEMELCAQKKFSNVYPVMGRVQHRSMMERVFRHYRPQVVFHAAACKHVPMVEVNPWEGIFNNVIGSQVVMDLAEAFGVERLVLISTDKAVRPANVMGASKRTAEILMQGHAPGRTRFMAVRFGNVMGSSGSVIPLFQQQIRDGGPVTVTHPDVTRYFMMIPEACQLVLQAGAMGKGGEILILEMGTPVKIADMARDLIRLSGKRPDVDIRIEYTGMRPGEKLYEELITQGEGIVPTPHGKIMVLKRDRAAASAQQVREMVDDLYAVAEKFDAAAIKHVLRRIVPEYQPSGPEVVDPGA